MSDEDKRMLLLKKYYMAELYGKENAVSFEVWQKRVELYSGDSSVSSLEALLENVVAFNKEMKISSKKMRGMVAPLVILDDAPFINRISPNFRITKICLPTQL